MAEYVIIGGHGKVARHALPLLASRGHRVTAVIRNPEHAADVEAAGGLPLVLDVEHATREDLVTVFTGKDAVIWSAGAGGGNPQRTVAVDQEAAIRSVDAAEAAGVRRYVMVSYFGAGPDHGVPEGDSFYAYAQAKAAADAYLRDSALDWTVLGPARLTDEAPTGRIDLAPLAPGSVQAVSRGNVARTIVATLEQDATIQKTLDYIDGTTDIPEALAQP